MRLRRTAFAALLAAGILVPAAGTATVAFAQPGSRPAAVQKAKPKPVKTKKAVRTPFAAIGKVTAVDAAAGTVTLLATGGTRDVRRKTVTVAVPAAVRVVINSKRVTLAAVAVGARITVTGRFSAGTYTAAKVQVTQRKKPVVTPSPTPPADPTPTDEPTDEPTEDPGVDPTPTEEPTGDPAPTEEPAPTEDPTPSASPSPGDEPSEDPAEEILGDLSD